MSRSPTENNHMSDKSLTALTTKFMTLLRDSQNGILDLRSLIQSIPSRQKRRVYDITNVLEGIGLIEKYSKNSIRWKGGGPRTNSVEDNETISQLKDELELLDDQEKCLDEQIKFMEMNRKIVNQDPVNGMYNYLTHEDMCQAFPSSNDTLIVVKGDESTVVEVPEPMYIYNNATVKQKYQVNLKSSNEPIDVYLVNRKRDSSSQETSDKKSDETQKSETKIKEMRQRSKSHVNPLILLTPTPTAQDYSFNMDRSEGTCDLFDINTDQH